MSRIIVHQHLLVTALACPHPDVIREWLQGPPSAEVDELLAELAARRRESAASLQAVGLWATMAPEEQDFLLVRPQDVTERALRDVAWLMEASECLLWALGLLETLPPFDTQADVEHLRLLPPGTVQELQGSASLRDIEELKAAREVAELWHWRSRTRQLIESAATLPPGTELNKVIRAAAEKAVERGDLTMSVDGDFPLFGRAYAKATADEWAQATSIAMERHRALNWLCGYAPRNRWADTPTHT